MSVQSEVETTEGMGSQQSIKGLRQQPESQRKIELSEEIRKQMKKILETRSQLQDITDRLLSDKIDCFGRNGCKKLNKKYIKKRNELIILEEQLQMLTAIETNKCKIEVEVLSYRKSEDCLYTQVFVRNDDYNVMFDNKTEVNANNGYHRSESKNRSTSESETSQVEGNPFSTLKHSTRISVVPQRYEWVPSGDKQLRRFNDFDNKIEIEVKRCYRKSKPQNKRTADATKSRTIDCLHSTQVEGNSPKLIPKRTAPKRVVTQRKESLPSDGMNRFELWRPSN